MTPCSTGVHDAKTCEISKYNEIGTKATEYSYQELTSTQGILTFETYSPFFKKPNTLSS